MYKNQYRGKNNLCGENIARLRQQYPDLSQRKMVQELGILGCRLHKNAIQRIESGERFVSDIELAIFARYFCVPADELLRQTPRY